MEQSIPSKLIENVTQSFDIPEDSRPTIAGLGNIDPLLIAFTNLIIEPLGVFDEAGMETTAFLMAATLKKNGVVLASIPFFYRYGNIRIASFSLFNFTDDTSIGAESKLLKFKEFIMRIIKTF